MCTMDITPGCLHLELVKVSCSPGSGIHCQQQGVWRGVICTMTAGRAHVIMHGSAAAVLEHVGSRTWAPTA